MPDIVAELTELNQAIAAAEFSADLEFFRCHLADGLRFRRASGKVVDKVTFLTPSDPWLMVLTTVMLSVVAVLAGIIPARRTST